MADTIMMPFMDLIKYYIERTYIQFEDPKLNILIYSVVSIALSLFVKLIFQYDLFIYYKNYCIWLIIYKIFKKQIYKFPINSRNELFSPINTKNELFTKELRDISANIFREILRLKIEHGNQGNNTNSVSYVHNFRLPNNLNEKKTKFILSLKSMAYFYKITSTDKYVDLRVIAYINGYYILVSTNDFTNNNTQDYYTNNKNDIILYSNDNDALELFLEYMQNVINTNNNFMPNNSNKLNIVEYSPNLIKTIGSVKTHLNFDNYVSRHKNNIMKKLKAIDNGNLYNHPYIENNLGILLHGDYGTGKTFLISAIANYLKRSIFNVNFSRIKTKSALSQIMNEENISKYIYSFDEFDYLISDMLNDNNSSNNDELKMKLQVLSTQIANCPDKETATPLIEEMKKIMENGNSDKLTYPHLLSELSGLTSMNNRVIIATTNFPEKIPKALLRPGRLDNIIHLGKFNSDEIKELLIKIYKPNAEQYKIIKETTFPEDVYTPALIIRESCSCDGLEDMINSLISSKFKSNF